jgi:hypothetical protein
VPTLSLLLVPLSPLSLVVVFFVVVADFGVTGARCVVVVRRGVVGTAALTACRATASSAPLPYPTPAPAATGTAVVGGVDVADAVALALEVVDEVLGDPSAARVARG